MSVRRLHPVQPESFSFNAESIDWAKKEIAKYPPGRQASAVLALLWRAQDEHDGWLPEPAIRYVAEFLDMSYIRVLEIATFYTMFNLAPLGKHLIQVCTTTPCWLRGSDAVVAACKKVVGKGPQQISDDGKLSWMEVECLGACVNAPVIQIGKDYYEDLDGEKTEALLNRLRRGDVVTSGPQIARQASAPVGGATTLKAIPGGAVMHSGTAQERNEA
jgi:NADH-quinone oxidoreductase subunit E